MSRAPSGERPALKGTHLVAETEWDRVRAERDEMIARAERYADRGMGVHADVLRRGGDLPPRMAGTPMIIDTDVGGDPDDAVALVLAALHVPELALVITSDELDGQRARFARLLLDQAGRPEVPVVAGQPLGRTRGFCVADLIPAGIPAHPTDVAAAAATVIDTAPGLVRWVGMGPLSNLANLSRVRPDLALRLEVTQMGGAVNYRDPSRAEHNVRLDPAAAASVLAPSSTVDGRRRPWLVTSDVTFRPEIEIRRDSPVYRALAALRAVPWAVTLRAHLDRWFDRFHDGTMQHDALTLTAALRLPFVEFTIAELAFDRIGRMTAIPVRGLGAVSGTPMGPTAYVSRSARYDAFNRWLEEHLGAAAFALGDI